MEKNYSLPEVVNASLDEKLISLQESGHLKIQKLYKYQLVYKERALIKTEA